MRQPTSPEEVRTHCPYCALNCGLTLETEGGRIVERAKWKASPLTAGALCSKGMTAHEQVHHEERIVAPLLRVGDDFVEIGWEEALDRAAYGFMTIAGASGAAANAVLSGGSLTNEKVYLMGKLARLALGTPHIDYNGRFCMTSAGAANLAAFGADRMMSPLEELDRAEVAVVIGANLSAAFPVVVPGLLAKLRQRGGRVVVIDPRGSRFVQPGDLHLALRPGSDGALFAGVLREIVDSHRVVTDFVVERTHGLDEARRAVDAWDPPAVLAATGLAAADYAAFVDLIADTDRVMYLHGRGPEQQLQGTGNVSAIINVGLARAHVGRPGCGINMLTGQRNGQGGREWGQRCNQLPAGRRIDDSAHRAVVAERWGVDPTVLPGVGDTYVELLQAAGRGEVRGLLSICTNMSVSAPDLRAVEQQMAALDFLVVVDPFFSPSARHADLVLPGSTFAEESGTITTLEGRVVRIDQAVEPISGRSDHDIIRALAERLGAGQHFAFENAEEVFEEMRVVSAGGPVDYAGMTYARIRDEGGLCWPCPDESHPGTPMLYTEQFAHPDGRARFVATDPSPPSSSEEFPLVLTTGRVLSQFLSGNQTMRIEAQQRRDPAPFVEIHPLTAADLGLDPDGDVQLTSRQDVVTVPWRANPDLRADTLFMPYHWVECNRLVAADLDPVSRIPGFKFTPVAAAAVEAT